MRGLVWGVAVGLLIPALVLGVGATHLVCTVGPVIGSSGWIASPDAFALAPPGGFVNFSFYELTVFNSSSSSAWGSYSELPLNTSVMDFNAVNWTLHDENSSVAFGWGSNAPCRGVSLAPGFGGAVPGLSGCSGPITQPAPAGVGQRLDVPLQFTACGLPSAVVNATYGSTPLATFSWVANATSVGWDDPPALQAIGASPGPFNEHGQLFGLAITLKATTIDFGVPIHLLNGSQEIIPASFPQDYPWGPPGGTNLTISWTYVLPMTTGQGTWSVYLPGDSGPFSPGGLLFEQTSSVPPTF